MRTPHNNMDGRKARRIFSLGLLLLLTQSCHYVPLASGQGKHWFHYECGVDK